MHDGAEEEGRQRGGERSHQAGEDTIGSNLACQEYVDHLLRELDCAAKRQQMRGEQAPADGEREAR